MAELFPILQPPAAEASGELPLCREIAWDFETGVPIYENGAPVFVTGAQAVKVWIYKALKTERFRYEIYSAAFGSEVEELIGQNYSEELKSAEAKRYVRECLEINPYITDVQNIGVEFLDGRLTVSTAVSTIYGEVKIDAA